MPKTTAKNPSTKRSGTKAETYRPIGEIVAELGAIEKEAAETDTALRDILKQLAV